MADVPDYFFRQSAVVPVRERAGRLEVLLITSRKKKRWVIPKGVKEPTLSGADSAAKEALEEAGVEGVVCPTVIGSYEYAKWGGVCTVEVFVMRVSTIHDAWEEQYRDREWVDVASAVERLREAGLKQIVKRVPQLLITSGDAQCSALPEDRQAPG